MKQVVLQFPNQEHMDAFLGQVSDGAMEDICSIEEVKDIPSAVPTYEIKMNYIDDPDNEPFDPEYYGNHQYDGVDFGDEEQSNDDSE